MSCTILLQCIVLILEKIELAVCSVFLRTCIIMNIFMGALLQFFHIEKAMCPNPFGIAVLAYHVLEVTIVSLVAKYVLRGELHLVLIWRISLYHVVCVHFI